MTDFLAIYFLLGALFVFIMMSTYELKPSAAKNFWILSGGIFFMLTLWPVLGSVHLWVWNREGRFERKKKGMSQVVRGKSFEQMIKENQEGT